MYSLEGKVALITGASKGIGEAIARAYVLAGAKVVINSRKQDAVNEVANALNTEGSTRGGQAIGIAGQVGDKEDCQRLVDGTIKAFGRIDILVNNAATNPVFAPLENTDERAFDKIMDVNVKAPFVLAKLCLPYMEQNSGGSIINISSVEGITPGFGLGIYSVSKAALIQLTKAMAAEWGKSNIRVNAICPGLIQTKFSQALWSNEEVMQHALSKIPLHRMGQPEEMAGFALFLASEAASYCTGGVYAADGGYLI